MKLNGTSIALGTAIGVVIGLLMDNVIAGIGIGIAIAIALTLPRARSRKRRTSEG
ncbi:hypothetical protein ACLBKU_13355 [Erythrobacter sp. NE805]|uniref:hypothetical protein n=1 Tax=Erythrobacter sp. NE805 TaxID=3389875 RepID=UPI00396B30F8